LCPPYDVAVDVLRDLIGNERYTEMPTPELGSERHTPPFAPPHERSSSARVTG
jgi:hypothetical protein